MGKSSDERATRRRRRGPVGASPGVLPIDPAAPAAQVSVITYGPDAVEERPLSVADLGSLRGAHPVTWVNIDGVSDAKTLNAVGAAFGLHPLALEDVHHVQPRAKAEHYDEHLFVVIPMVREQNEHELTTEQIAIFIGSDYVVTFQELAGDCLDPVRKRIRSRAGRIRRSGADYLGYAIIDAVVDGFFPAVERQIDRIEALEDGILTGAIDNVGTRVHQSHKSLRTLRHIVVPLRAAIGSLVREESPRLTRKTQVYLRDCHDHAVHLVEAVEAARDTAVSLMDLHLAMASHRMSEVMRVLTVIATIFIPLTFIAGVYGMNFRDTPGSYNMPELSWKYGYPFALLLMLGVAGALVGYFWHRRWLGRRR